MKLFDKILLLTLSVLIFLVPIPGSSQISYDFEDTGGTLVVPPIDFGSQEVLLSTQLELLIQNTSSGLGFLNINNIAIEIQGLVDYSHQWNLVVEDDLGNPVSYPVSSGATTFPLHLFVTFKPEAVAPFSSSMSVNLRISSNADTGPPAENIIQMQGMLQQTVINYSLVLDRSGSMNFMEPDGLGGMKRRIDLTSEAADYFLGLEYLRVEDLPTFPGDQIGIVKYNNTVDGTYLPLSTATNTLLMDAQTNLVSTSAASDVAFIGPQGGTATGNAVIESITNHLATPATGDVKNVIILLSDGYENVGSLITDVGAGSVSSEISARPDINIYSIGMGNANMASLEAYSDLSGLATPQTFYYDLSNPMISDPMALNSFFFKIYQNAIGLASVIDPTYYVNLTSSDWIDIAETPISSSDRQITISITYPEELSDITEYQMIQPSGSILSEGSVNGLNTVRIEGRNHTIYQVTFENNTDPGEYVGLWTLQGRGAEMANDSTNRDRETNSTPQIDLSNVPVGFAIASLSGLTIDVNAATGNVQPGDEIVVTVEPEDISDPDGEVEIEELDVTITTPDGKEVGCPPVEDPCGNRVVTYPYTQKKGIYQVYVRAILINNKGERTMRDAYQQVVVSNNKKILGSDNPPANENAKWIRILIILSIIILLLLLILLFRKRKEG